MPKGQAKHQENQEPLKEGEFHWINGIGPGIEKRLHSAGIETFNQLASLTPEEISEKLNGLVSTKPDDILRKDWTGQAALYALELEKTRKTVEAEETTESQHYESYVVELLLDDLHNVLRTRITHVKSGAKDGWAGWEMGKLDHWIQSQAGLHHSQAALHLPPAQQSIEAEKGKEPFLPQEPLYGKGKSSIQEIPASVRPKGSISISEVKIMDPTENRAGRFFDSGIPFEIHLSLLLNNTDQTPGEVLEYRANVLARRLGTADHFEAGQITGKCNASNSLKIIVPVEGLPAGTYRLDTFVQVDIERSFPPERESLQAISEGEIIQIHAID